MKKIILVAGILFSWVLSAQGADLKIGYVDLNKALNESDSGKNILQQFLFRNRH